MLKPIPSNPAYLISDSGQVFSTKSNRYLKTPCGNVGYPLVNLTAGKGKRTTHTVHSLLATTASNTIYDSIDDIMDKLLTDPTTSWKSITEEYGCKCASSVRKLIMRDLKRSGRTSDIDKLSECMQKRNLDKLHEDSKGRPAHNRKQVKCNGVIYASLKEACNALGLFNSKACVAINKGKAIKGFHLVYA